MAGDRIRILLADPQPLVCDALAVALSQEDDFEILSSRPTGGADVLEATFIQKPDVVVLEYWMDILGTAATNLILHRLPGCKVLLLAWLFGPDEVSRAVAAGASGFFPKTLQVSELADGIRRASGGEAPVFAKQMKNLVRKIKDRQAQVAEDWDQIASLTPKEVRILKSLSLGRGVEEICEELSISRTTVRTHIQNLLKKTGAHSQLEAVSIARDYGVVSN